MSELALGTFAGGALLAGLPLGRFFRAGAVRRRLLRSGAAGILIFLALDLAGHMVERPVELLAAARAGTGSAAAAVGMLALVAIGGVIGWLAGTRLDRVTGTRGGLPAAARIALLTAAAVGGYNLLQGLAIGQAGRFTAHTAVSEGDGLALLLLGFLLHNGIKGLAIVAPLIGAPQPLSGRFLLVLGLIAGLPTLLGSAVGARLWWPELFILLFSAALALMLVALGRMGAGARPIRGRSLAAGSGGFLIAVLFTFALEISQYSLPELLSTFRLPG